MFTIKSESNEGTYYLVRRQKKHKKIWVKREFLTEEMLFPTSAGAKKCLTRLLKVMPEYASDTFTLVEIN